MIRILNLPPFKSILYFIVLKYIRNGLLYSVMCSDDGLFTIRGFRTNEFSFGKIYYLNPDWCLFLYQSTNTCNN